MLVLPTPNKDRDNYRVFMRSLGCVSAAKKELIRPHWPGLVEYDVPAEDAYEAA
jgi:hypothetical protein